MVEFTDYVTVENDRSLEHGLHSIKSDDNCYGLEDINGNVIVPCQYLNMIKFYEGIAAVKSRSGLWGYIDANGKELTPFKYKCAHNFSKGVAIVAISYNEWGYINRLGEEIIPCEYKRVEEVQDGIGKVYSYKIGMMDVDLRSKIIKPEITYNSVLTLKGSTICLRARSKKELNIKKISILRLIRSEVSINDFSLEVLLENDLVQEYKGL